jgi:hypothetical protein
VFLSFTFCALSFALVYAQPITSAELIKNSRL